MRSSQLNGALFGKGSLAVGTTSHFSKEVEGATPEAIFMSMATSCVSHPPSPQKRKEKRETNPLENHKPKSNLSQPILGQGLLTCPGRINKPLRFCAQAHFRRRQVLQGEPAQQCVEGYIVRTFDFRNPNDNMIAPFNRGFGDWCLWGSNLGSTQTAHWS